VPETTPVTTPEDDPTVAVAAALLVHDPPLIELANVVVDPAQTVAVPDIVPADAEGVILTEVVTTQPVEAINEMVAVPERTPVTIPVVEPIVAIVVFALDHVPELVLLSVVVPPTHVPAAPVIDPGAAFTVTVATAVPAVDV
jgi:hypothetical protein